MSSEIAGIIGIAVLIVLLLARMWIGVAMAIVGLVGILYLKGFDTASVVAGIVPFQKIAYYPFTPLPLFLLMGVVVSNSGIGSDAYDAAYKWIGRVRGGLSIATVIACALLASITGHSGAAIVTMSKVAIPEMKKYKYDDKLAAGSTVCGGTLAFLIPPSLAFIVYAVLTEQSIGTMFMAGILPGILLASLFVGTIIIITTLNPKAGPVGPKTSFRVKVTSLKGTWHLLLLFLLVIGGIYTGIFTPTEAGAIGAFGSMVISIATRRLTFKDLGKCLTEAAMMTAMIVLLMVGAFILTKFVALSQVTFLLGKVTSQLPVSPYIIFAGIVFIYIILGMFLDIFGAVTLTIPFTYPVAVALGFDPVWFGVIIVILIEMGLVTPPIGFDAFMLSGVSGIPLGTIFRGVWPFVVATIICIIILTIFPQIALFLPSTMYG